MIQWRVGQYVVLNRQKTSALWIIEKLNFETGWAQLRGTWSGQLRTVKIEKLLVHRV